MFLTSFEKDPTRHVSGRCGMNRLRTCLLASVCGWAPSGIAGILEAPKFIKDSWNKEVAASDLEFNTKTWIRMFLDGKDQDLSLIHI